MKFKQLSFDYKITTNLNLKVGARLLKVSFETKEKKIVEKIEPFIE